MPLATTDCCAAPSFVALGYISIIVATNQSKPAASDLIWGVGR